MITRRDMLRIGSSLTVIPFLDRLSFAEAAEDSTACSSRDPLDYVNVEFRATLEALIPTLNSYPPSLNTATLAQNRALEAKRQYPPPIPKPAITEHSVPGQGGNPDVRVFLVGAAPGASKPAVLHIHGGGYVGGRAAEALRAMQKMSEDLDCIVVTVDYRLAPETKFPGSLDDNYAALRWMNANAKELGIDVNRIAVKGESAGGGHAAALAIAVRDRREFSLCKQILIYPMLDDRTGSIGTVSPCIGHFIWTPAKNRFGWSSLLGVPAGSKNVPVNAVPARVSNLEGLPAAFIGVGSIDLFAPEDLEYSRRLLDAGVSTELLLIPGAFHAFDRLCPEAPLTLQFEEAWTQALRRSFNTGLS